MLWFQVLVIVVVVAWVVAAWAYIREVNRPKVRCYLPKLGWKDIVWPRGHEEVMVVQPQIVESGVLQPFNHSPQEVV
jgi:hypothetical protein